MTVIVWTSSNKRHYVRRVCKPVFDTTGTQHEVVGLEANVIPTVNKGDVLLAMGGGCVDAMKYLGAIPKNRTIKSLREKRHDYAPGSLLISYDPGIVEIDAAREPEIKYDVQLACRLHDHNTLNPLIGDYEYVTTLNKVMAEIKEQFAETGKAVYVATDLETIGFDPFFESEVPWEDPQYYPDARIISISFTVKEGTAYVYYVPEEGIHPKVREQIKTICTSDKVKLTGANLKFDIGWMLFKWNIMVTNQSFDTGLVGCLLDENRSNSLNLHAKIWTAMGGYDDEFNATFDKSRMDKVPKEDLLPYAGGDTDACLQVTHKQRKLLLRDKKLTRFYMNILQPASIVFAKLEHRGVYVDLDQYDVLQERCQKEQEAFHEAGLACIPRRLQLKYKDNLSLTRPKLIKEFLFTKRGLNLKPQQYTEKAKEETWEYAATAAEHLELFRQHRDAAKFIEAYGGFNQAKKTLSTYIVGFRKHLRSDGKFHPSYNMYKGDFGGGGDDSGTVTGRLSARDPAYQTIPKHTKWAKPLRTVYIAPPGMAILKLDFSQGELRVTACVANEITMLKAYKNGIDMHLKTGAEVAGISFQEALDMKEAKDDNIEEIRQGGKAGNFGLIYRMSPQGFVNYAWRTYGVDLTLKRANEFHGAFFELYPGLLVWHDRYIELARKQGGVRNPLGRIRHLPMIHSRDTKIRNTAERQSINSPIQSCLSDMMLLGMVLIDKEYPDLHMFGMTHDEVQVYVPEDKVDVWASTLGDILENLPLHDFDWRPQLEFPIDSEWSTTNLAECVSFTT